MLPELPASLQLLPVTLARAMDRSSVVRLRRGARKAALMAIEVAGLSDPRIDAALAALDSGRTGDGPARDALLRLLEDLDNAAWAARQRVASGAAPDGEHQRLYRMARSANALWAALDADPAVAAADAAYEAHAVLEDWEPLMRLWA
jgi:hypothetical protein